MSSNCKQTRTSLERPPSGSADHRPTGSGTRSEKILNPGQGVLMWLLIVSLLLAPLACSPEAEDPSLALSAPERAALAEFIATLREVYTRGDFAAVEALIAEDSEHRVNELGRRHLLPKGPTNIVGYRIVPFELPDGPIFTLAGVEYEFTVAPLGKLIFDVEDVSIGTMQISFLVGQRDGVFRIAGYQAIR